MEQRIITEQVLLRFCRYLQEAERSEHTICKYLRDLRKFQNTVGEKSLCKNDVLYYKTDLCKQYAPTSVNSVLSSLNSFFTFMHWEDLKVKTIKIQRKIFVNASQELSKAEYKKLLETAKQQKNLRMYYLLQTIASTGVRVSELKYITIAAVKHGCAVIYGKGKIRQILLPRELCVLLLRYAKIQNIHEGAVFVTRTSMPLDRSYIWRSLKKLCVLAHVSPKKVYPHNLRHLFARTYYSVQKDIVRLADLLGHTNINTTRIYTVESGETHSIQLQQLGLLRCENLST